MTVNIFPAVPVWTIVLVTLAAIALLAHGSRLLLGKNIPTRWVAILGGLRTAAIVLFLLALLRPAIAYTRSAEQKKHLIVLADTSGSMTAVESAPGSSRLQDLMKRISSAGLTDRLGRKFDLHWFSFDQEARPTDAGTLARPANPGAGTDLARGLERALEQYQSEKPNAAEVAPEILLLSDGNHLTGGDVIRTARELGVRISTLAPAEPQSQATPNAFTIASVQAPPRVLAGSVCRLTAAVRRTDTQPATAELILEEKGKPIARRKISFAAGERDQHVDLYHRPTELGAKHYQLKIVTASAAAEQSKASAKRSRPHDVTLQVLGRSASVLIVEDSIRWEFKFLKRLIEDDPNFACTTFLSRGSGVYMQSVEAEHSLKLGGLPQSRAELDYFDIIVLGDAQPKQWPANLASAIHHAVTERGTSLIHIAGPHLDQVAANQSLAALLPVELSDRPGQPVEGPIAVQLCVGQSTFSPFFALGATAWRDLPPLDQIYPVVRKRPGATPLLEAADRAAAYGNLLVMAEHTVGRGRALFVATDTLWKWQTLAKFDEDRNTPYRRFWQQTLRAMTPPRPGGNREAVVLTADRSKYIVGDRVQLTAKTTAPSGQSTASATGAAAAAGLNATVRMPDGRRFPLGFAPSSTEPGNYAADFEVTKPGSYTLEAAAAIPRHAAETALQFTAEPQPAELDRTSNNHELLDALAQATGGTRVHLDRKETWPDATAPKPPIVQRAVILDLWNSFGLLLCLVAVMGLDWLLRLLKGFV